MTQQEPVVKPTEVTETSVGLVALKDFNNLFGYGLNIPSLVIGENRKKTKEQLIEEYPNAMQYLQNVQQLTKYIKSYGSGRDVNSFKFRINHLSAMRSFLNIVSRMQFIKAANDQITMYLEEDVGWGLLAIDYQYKDGKLVDTKVTLGDQELDLSNPVVINAVDWEGNLVTGIQLIDRNVGQSTKTLRRDENGMIVNDELGNAIYDYSPVAMDLAIQITEDSIGNEEIYEQRARKYGAINKSDPRLTMQTSPLDYLVVRIANDDLDEELSITGYETPAFLALDYNLEIPFLEHINTLEKYNQMCEQGLNYNSRHFAGLNLFRWGILDKSTWDRGLAIYNAVTDAPALNGDAVDTLVDSKVVQWANACIEELKSKETEETVGVKIDENSIVSGTNICTIASTLSRSYFKARALVVTDIEKDDLGFKDVTIAFRSRPSISRRFQSISRTPTDLYKIVELDDEGNIVGIINPVDVFAMVRHDIQSVVVEFKADFVNDDSKNDVDSIESLKAAEVAKEAHEFYLAIGAYK